MNYLYDVIYSKITPNNSDMMLEIPTLTHRESQMPLATKAEIFSLEEPNGVQMELDF